jgi:hypothetical protein
VSGLLLFLLGLAVGALSTRVRRWIRVSQSRHRRVLPVAASELGRAERLRGIAGVIDGRADTVGSRFAVTWHRRGLRFSYCEQSCGGVPWGVVAVRHPKAALPAVQIRRRGRTALTPPLAAARPVPSGVPGFDERMELSLIDSAPIESNPVDRKACAQFMRLDSLLPASPALDAHHSHVRVCFPGVLSGDPDCRLVLEEACRLLAMVLGGQVPLETEAGMEYVDTAVREEGPDVLCGVCGEAIVGERTLCARCSTPHHSDCWRYAGGCTVFACQGKESQ